MKWQSFISAGLVGFATQASAQVLELPAPATRTYEFIEPNGAYSAPIGPWRDGQVESLPLTGDLSLEAWRLGSEGHGSHILMANLSGQLAEAGFEVLYQCSDAQCGGFDFRFAIPVVAEPNMHVDLGEFRYLAAHKAGEDGGEYTTLLVSRSPGAQFVQIARIGPAGGEGDVSDSATITSTMTDPASQTALPEASLEDQLTQNGYAVLSDLVFETGSSDLGEGPFDSLTQLGLYLAAHPEHTIALVGHTDAEGSLEVNITLSKRRAASVRARLINSFDLPAEQMVAEGVGFLAPLGSNLTDEGRTQNRRVEVVLTATQ